MNWLRRAYFTLKYPDVCWKHRCKLTRYTSYCGDSDLICSMCVDAKKKKVADRAEAYRSKLKEMGVKLLES